MSKYLVWLLPLAMAICPMTGAEEWAFQVEQAPPAAAASEPEYELHVFGAKWCPACVAYKKQMPALEKILPVVQHDVDAEKQWSRSQANSDGSIRYPAVRSLPTVWLVRKHDQKVMNAWTGALSPAATGAALSRLRNSG